MSMKLAAIPGIRIAGAANAWPEELLGSSARLSNEQVYAHFLGNDWRSILAARQWSPDRPAQEFGVTARGWTRGSSVTSLELSIAAAEKALTQSGISPGDLNCIFSATCTPFQISSTLAGKIARHLKTDAAAIDIRAGGAAGLNSMATAALYHSHGCKVSLVVATEASSQYVASDDLANGLLFGDGASAMVLVSDPDAGQSGLVGAVMGNADWKGKPFTVPGRLPPAVDCNAKDYRFQIPDHTYRACLTDTWARTAEHLLRTFPAQCSELNAMLPYAITRPQVLSAVEPFNAPCNAALTLLENHGCIGCASPMAALVQHMQNGATSGANLHGEIVGSMAVAGGISWSGLLWRL